MNGPPRSRTPLPGGLLAGASAAARAVARAIALGLALAAPSHAPGAGLEVDDSLFLGSWSPYATRYAVRRPVCAWSEAGGAYRVVADTLETPGRFELVGDVGDRVRYTVRWRDRDGADRWETLSAGLPSGEGYRLAEAPGCPGAGTEILVLLSTSDADGAPGGLYSSTLTLTLVAE